METREIYSSDRNFMDGIQILTDMLCTVRTILAGENTVCSLIDGGDSSNEKSGYPTKQKSESSCLI